MRLTAGMVLALMAGSAQAHLVGPTPHEFSWWRIDPLAAMLLILVGVAYWRGSRQQARRAQSSPLALRQRQRYFWAGWAFLAAALGSPLDPLGEQLFSAHMVQHEVIMLLAAPLLVMSRPSGALLRGSPAVVGRGLGGLLRGRRLGKFWRWLAIPLVAWVVHAVVLWGWHLPALFSASLLNTWIHAVQHLSFLWVALLFWWALANSRKQGSAVGVIYLFTTAVHASGLGALLTFSPELWYLPYATTTPDWGLTAIEDQQLGGLIMWVPSGLVFIAAGLVDVACSLRGSDRRMAKRIELHVRP